MNFDTICVITMLVIWKLQKDSNYRWWIAFAIILTIAAQFGFHIRMFGLIIAVGVWKVFTDICQAGGRS